MGRSLTNNLNLQYAIEQTETVGSSGIGVLPGSPLWRVVEPNSIDAFAATITSVARDPISKLRQRRKGTITDLDSTADLGVDLTISHVLDFAEGFFFAKFSNQYVERATVSVTGVSTFTVTIDPGTRGVQAGSLVFVRGFVNAANNGLFVVASTTATTVVVTASNLVVESANNNAEIELAGFRSSAGDFDINASGNLTTAAEDFTTFGLKAGQFIYIGGDAAINRFTNAANRGWARVKAIAAGVLTLDKKEQTFATEANTTQEVDIYFGRFLRNVSVDDADFIERSFQFELAYDSLSETIPGNAMYEYSKGNFANEMTIDMPLADKATISFSFIGTDTEPPVEAADRKTNAATPLFPNKTAAYNTTADLARLRVAQIDETGLTSDFKSMSLTINNNVSPEKVLGLLGAKYMNAGNFDIDIESQAIFTDARVATAVRTYESLTMDFAVINDDGGLYFDIPSMTLGGGDREFPVDESILINLAGQAFSDPILNTSLSLSVFPFLPSIASA